MTAGKSQGLKIDCKVSFYFYEVRRRFGYTDLQSSSSFYDPFRNLHVHHVTSFNSAYTL